TTMGFPERTALTARSITPSETVPPPLETARSSSSLDDALLAREIPIDRDVGVIQRPQRLGHMPRLIVSDLQHQPPCLRDPRDLFVQAPFEQGLAWFPANLGLKIAQSRLRHVRRVCDDEVPSLGGNFASSLAQLDGEIEA